MLWRASWRGKDSWFQSIPSRGHSRDSRHGELTRVGRPHELQVQRVDAVWPNPQPRSAQQQHGSSPQGLSEDFKDSMQHQCKAPAREARTESHHSGENEPGTYPNYAGQTVGMILRITEKGLVTATFHPRDAHDRRIE